MRTKIILAGALMALMAKGQPAYVDTVTPRTNTVTYSGVLTVPGVSTNAGVTLRNTNNISYGDPLSTAFGTLNTDLAFLWNYLLTNDFAGTGAVTNGNYLVKTNGTGSDLTIARSFTLLSTNIISYTLTGITITNSGITNVDGPYGPDGSGGVEGTTNGVVITFIPPVALDPDASNYLSAAGVTNLLPTLFVNQLVTDLKTNGLWSKCLVVYPFAAGTPAGDAINLLGTNYTIDWSGFLSTAAAHGEWGVSNNGTAAFGDTHFVPSGLDATALTNLAFSIWLTPVTNPASYVIGALDSAGAVSSILAPQSLVRGIINVNNVGPYAGITLPFTNSGTVIYSQTGTNLAALAGSTDISNVLTAAFQLPATNLFVGNINYNGGAQNPLVSLGFAAVTTGLTTNEMLAMKNVVDRYDAWRPERTVAPDYTFVPPLASTPTVTSPYPGIPPGHYMTFWQAVGTNGTWVCLGSSPPGFINPFTQFVWRCGSGPIHFMSTPLNTDPVTFFYAHFGCDCLCP